ncbi:MAG: YicC family protein [Oscillospiraceae bacterium]|nr:YicC family protein [Oscillospiraceae bacterium]MBR4346318.1 YicC family protein [Oscillospiraceae bacterium]
MIKSMTGFGRASEVMNGREITVELRSVNHRYFELTSRVPRNMGFLEERLKGYMNGRIGRGKVELNVTVNTISAQDMTVTVNMPAAKAYVDALREAGDALSVTDDLTLSSIMRLPDIFTVKKNEADEESIWTDVRAVADKAVAGFIAMREREGERLREDILERLDVIERQVGEIERLSPAAVEEYHSKLYARLSELLADRDIDESRIVTEAAIFADKTAVAEETVRLHSHIRQLTEMLDSDEAVGRKADFLVQEFNREANTIGSKAQDIAITRLVVDMKSEIEKIREQIQNVE